MRPVSHIFGSEAKVKIMRLFIFNPSLSFTSLEVAGRTKERSSTVRREIRSLQKAGLIKRRARGFTLNPSFIYLPAVENFLIDATPLSEKEVVRRISRAGNVKLILISGVFVHDRDARVDILIVGDHLKQGILVSIISMMEAELGKELRYAAFETADFNYRLGIYDKLIRDILDYPHRKILNKLGL